MTYCLAKWLVYLLIMPAFKLCDAATQSAERLGVLICPLQINQGEKAIVEVASHFLTRRTGAYCNPIFKRTSRKKCFLKYSVTCT